MRDVAGIAILLLCAMPSWAAQADHDPYLDQFLTAERQHRPFRPITSFDIDTGLNEAYAIQHQLVDRKRAGHDRIAGYRGGLMSEDSMRQRSVHEPLVGVQFRSGRRHSRSSLSLRGYRHAAIEVKIGFLFGHDLPPGEISVERLRRAVTAIVPIIDLPDIAYLDPLRYSAVDMVAANISAAVYVAGRGRGSRRCIDLDAETVALSRDGLIVNRGRGSDSLGNIWRSLQILVRLAQRNGYPLRRGQLVMAGKLGSKLDARPGRYVASFRCLGAVSITLTE